MATRRFTSQQVPTLKLCIQQEVGPQSALVVHWPPVDNVVEVVEPIEVDVVVPPKEVVLV